MTTTLAAGGGRGAVGVGGVLGRRGRVSRALRLPDVTMGLGQRLREETQPG